VWQRGLQLVGLGERVSLLWQSVLCIASPTVSFVWAGGSALGQPCIATQLSLASWVLPVGPRAEPAGPGPPRPGGTERDDYTAGRFDLAQPKWGLDNFWT